MNGGVMNWSYLPLCFVVLSLLELNLGRCQAQQRGEWVCVGDAGNLANEAGVGRVAYAFDMGKFEVTATQYATFLNAVAAEDPNQLMPTVRPPISAQDDPDPDPFRGPVRRSGEPGSYHYAPMPGTAQQPMTWVNFWNVLRYANWLHNGSPTGPQGPTTTEDGAYTLTPSAMANNSVVRNAGARYFIPNQDEWVKTAYYRGGGQNAGYWDYPFQSNEKPVSSPPSGQPNSALFDYGGPGANFGISNPVNVGSYPNSVSPFGTLDQGGNVWEWSETRAMLPEAVESRLIFGGGFLDRSDTSFGRGESTKQNIAFLESGNPAMFTYVGFRVARLPEPSSGLLVILGLLFSRIMLRR